MTRAECAKIVGLAGWVSLIGTVVQPAVAQERSGHAAGVVETTVPPDVAFPASKTVNSATDSSPHVPLPGQEQSADAMQQLVDTDPTEDGKLELVLEYALDGYEQITQDIQDYACTLVRRERVDGRMQDYQRIAVKIRHEQKQDDKVSVPFSVYLQFLTPERVEGREVLYVRGRNHGDLIARRGGRRNPNLTMQLVPTSPLAMADNRYPITEIGIKNLTKRLIEVVEEEREYNDGEVKIFRNAVLEGRSCMHIQLTHHDRRANLGYHKARVFVDNEWKIPVYFASFGWPTQEGGKPPLLEEYAYIDIRLNVGLTDDDFDVRNPTYHFNDSALDDLPEVSTRTAAP